MSCNPSVSVAVPWRRGWPGTRPGLSGTPSWQLLFSSCKPGRTKGWIIINRENREGCWAWLHPTCSEGAPFSGAVCMENSILLQRNLCQTKKMKPLDWTVLGFLEVSLVRVVCMFRQVFIRDTL